MSDGSPWMKERCSVIQFHCSFLKRNLWIMCKKIQTYLLASILIHWIFRWLYWRNRSKLPRSCSSCRILVWIWYFYAFETVFSWRIGTAPLPKAASIFSYFFRRCKYFRIPVVIARFCPGHSACVLYWFCAMVACSFFSSEDRLQIVVRWNYLLRNYQICSKILMKTFKSGYL